MYRQGGRGPWTPTVRDDIAPSGLGTIDAFSPHAFLDKLNSSGADKDHFTLMQTNPPPTLKFYRTEAYASSIQLPVVTR
ncbi:MAG: hypothetical protein Kow0099_22160 [Candidatus Abyssubacteria bacterium]